MPKNKKMEYEEALKKAAMYAAKREVCIQDVKTKLYNWKVPKEFHDDIIFYLLQEEFIDEERYAAAYVREKFRMNKWGKVKIIFQLKSKNIPSHLIEEALKEIEPEKYYSVLLELLEQKKRSVPGLEGIALRNKLKAYAAGRGFELDLINKALDQLKI